MATEVLSPLIGTYIGVLGACLGSFANVVIARLPEGQSVVRPRSRCPRCGHSISAWENIPVLSWFLLLGHCRGCKAPISMRYPLIELLGGVLAWAFWYRFDVSWHLLLWLPLAFALLIIAWIDLDHWFIPDEITYPCWLWAFAHSFLPGGLSPVEALLGQIPACGLALFAWLFFRITGREGMGFGDIKLLALVGAALGAAAALQVLFLASLLGAVVGTFLLGFKRLRGDTLDAAESPKDETQLLAQTETETAQENASDEEVWTPPKHAIPFGPFLVLATFAAALHPVFGRSFFYLIAESLT